MVFLNRLSPQASLEAILKTIQQERCPVVFNEESNRSIVEVSGGYPYFIQFICREVNDVFIRKGDSIHPVPVPVNEIVRKPDSDFFSGRLARATDRQRDLL